LSQYNSGWFCHNHAPRSGPSNVFPSARAVEPHPLAQGGHRLASIVTAPPQLDVPKSASECTTSANVRFAQFRVEARRRAALQVSRACGRLNHSGVPPGEALVVAQELLRHPPVRAEPDTPEGQWLEELASLIRKACPRPGAQGTRAIAGGPSCGDSWPPSQ
jgi:hypothetical protein